MNAQTKIIFYLKIDASKKQSLKNKGDIIKKPKMHESKADFYESEPIDAIEKVKALLEKIKNS